MTATAGRGDIPLCKCHPTAAPGLQMVSTAQNQAQREQNWAKTRWRRCFLWRGSRSHPERVRKKPCPGHDWCFAFVAWPGYGRKPITLTEVYRTEAVKGFFQWSRLFLSSRSRRWEREVSVLRLEAAGHGEGWWWISAVSATSLFFGCPSCSAPFHRKVDISRYIVLFQLLMHQTSRRLQSLTAVSYSFNANFLFDSCC